MSLVERAASGAHLRDGSVVHVRPIEPADADRLVRFHERLSPRTIRFRWFSYHPHLSEAETQRFTTVDHHDREAVVALAEDEIVGVVRFDRIAGTNDADVAFVVDDAWQGRGIATILFDHLIGLATSADVGIHRFVADTMIENWRMRSFFRDCGHDAEFSFADGLVHVTIPLGPSTP
jgi:RimJ/RimL family protein N-acetyltransferase